jgi:S-adenosylmethionine:tRNA ribosyltransferase-isomerase
VNQQDFHYDLPEEAIATHPVSPRSAARMLVFPADDNDSIADKHFTDLPEVLSSAIGCEQLWVNDTRVIRARLLMQKPTGGRLEIFLLEPVDCPMEQALLKTEDITMRCMVKGARRWKDGVAHLDLPGEWSDALGTWQLKACEVGAEVGHRLVAFDWAFLPSADDAEVPRPTWGDLVEALGAMPLPPYMRRPEEALDEVEYQTVYAQHPGSVAAPTAGLHFDHDLWQAVQAAGTSVHRVTLHVGAGTFVPLSEGNLEDHTMHAERCIVGLDAIQALAIPGVRRCATGTTSLRTLESLFWLAISWQKSGKQPDHLPQWAPYRDLKDHAKNLGWTFPDAMAWLAAQLQAPDVWTGEAPDLAHAHITFTTALMMVPGYQVRSVDALITNFHLPGSTLLCLVEAFVGQDWRNLYDHALRSGYRFLSYGDGSYLVRKDAAFGR